MRWLTILMVIASLACSRTRVTDTESKAPSCYQWRKTILSYTEEVVEVQYRDQKSVLYHQDTGQIWVPCPGDLDAFKEGDLLKVSGHQVERFASDPSYGFPFKINNLRRNF